MKKIVSVFISMVMLVALITPNIVYAKNQNLTDTCTSQALEPVTEFDNNDCLELVCSGNVSVQKDRVVFCKDRVLSQLNNTTTMCKDSIVLYPKKSIEELEENISLIKKAPSSSQYREAMDKSISVKAYTRVYYQISEENNLDYFRIISVSGGYSDGTDHVKVVSQALRIGCSGWYRGGYAQQQKNYKPSTSAWSYNAPSSWHKVAKTGGYYVGSYYSLTLKRFSSNTWTMSISNNL